MSVLDNNTPKAQFGDRLRDEYDAGLDWDIHKAWLSDGNYWMP